MTARNRNVLTRKPQQTTTGDGRYGMDLRIPGSRERWNQILLHTHAELTNVAPCLVPGAHSDPAGSAPVTRSEKQEKALLREVLMAEPSLVLEETLRRMFYGEREIPLTLAELGARLRQVLRLSQGDRRYAQTQAGRAYSEPSKPASWTLPVGLFVNKYNAYRRTLENAIRSEQDENDAERVRKNDHRLRLNAPKGGKATAHYNDGEVTHAFADYKRKHPGTSAWKAANALIRKGMALDKFKRVTGPWNRIKRMAAGQQGITCDAWFGSL